ncbi:MAG: fused MFS/spermidine synthase [Betaproteobacteria bacterium]|nr:fused MFS/spermidine synthase [Betaproteobacteria bacterium]
MILYALTIFTSAFLLFLVQPIVAKQILPWFGGSAAVWTTCLVFFQFLLLFGYAYSDWTTRKLNSRTQITLHIALLVASLASLPIIADASWKPDGDDDPTWRILGLLAATIGLPYFLLSTTGPLVQAWFARTFPAGTVYRLFALSNFGSLLALIAYPFAVEPWIATLQQSYGWTAAYVSFVLLCIASALYSVRHQIRFAAAAPAVAAANDGPVPRFKDYALWLLLPAMGSFMLLGVTNHITHDVASVPFLWILPLTLYLVTFILCFEGRGWYQRHIFLGPLLVVVGAMAWGLHADGGIMDIKEAIPLYSVGLFVCCMFFHGELADMKPAPRYLTTFYLMVSLGGALGGMVIGFIAPKLFNTYYEFGIGLVITGLIAAYLARRLVPAVPLLALGVAGFTAYHVYQYIDLLSQDARVMTRNFYGTLRVKDVGNESDEDGVRRLMHGAIMHGEQFLAPARQAEPTTYYGPTAGIGRAIKAASGAPMRVGVIGLGTGTLATYGRAGDVYRFYEINPQVVEIAQKEFSFLGKSGARIETVLGDARLAMEREPPQNYDLLVIDAFSSDSIPVHLVTREAFAVYLKHVKADGVIAFHVTNRFLQLAPVVKRIADEHGLHTALIVDEAEDNDSLAKTDWVLVSRQRERLEHREIAGAASEIGEIPGLRLWTDDFNNLFQILK